MRDTQNCCVLLCGSIKLKCKKYKTAATTDRTFFHRYFAVVQLHTMRTSLHASLLLLTLFLVITTNATTNNPVSTVLPIPGINADNCWGAGLTCESEGKRCWKPDPNTMLCRTSSDTGTVCINQNIINHDDSDFKKAVFCALACIAGVATITYLTYLFWKAQGPQQSVSTVQISTVPTTNTNNSTLTLSHSALLCLYGCPLLSCMYICLVISLFYNYEAVTTTTCGKDALLGNKIPGPGNFFPSVSACIGDFMPQKNLWRIATIMQQVFRCAAGVTTYFHYRTTLGKTAWKTNALRAACAVVESAGLVMLSSVSSDDNVLVHEMSFGFYAGAHALSMYTTIMLTKYCIHQATSDTTAAPKQKKNKSMLRYWQKALNYRIAVGVINIMSIILAIYFFVTSQEGGSHCQTYGWYSFFALSEWVYVVSSILFHHADHIDLWYVQITWSAKESSINDIHCL